MPGIKLTPIKPKVFPQQASKVEAAIRAASQRAAAELVADHEKTVSTWSTKPRFTVKVSASEIEVRTDSPIWRYVDQGTKPHVIRPKRPGGMLRFSTGYQAKTRPGSIIAGSGGASGPVAWAKEVQHPGTKARGFSRRLRAKWKEKYPRDMQRAISEALR